MVIDFDCDPGCACYQNCSDPNPDDEVDPNIDYRKFNLVHVTTTAEGDSTFNLYIKKSCQIDGIGCMRDGTPVPDLVARVGILGHYIVDRSSHFYADDNAGTGCMMQRTPDDDHEYDMYTYVNSTSFNIVAHAMSHVWEQGMGTDDPYLSPASMGAMNQIYDLLAEFAEKFRNIHPEWFDSSVKPLDKMKVIGNQQSPGYLYDIVRYRSAVDRAKSHMAALEKEGLPPLPGWEKPCPTWKADQISMEAFVGELAAQLKQKPHDQAAKAIERVVAGLADDPSEPNWQGQKTVRSIARSLTKMIDTDGSGLLSKHELESWLSKREVLKAFEEEEEEGPVGGGSVIGATSWTVVLASLTAVTFMMVIVAAYRVRRSHASGEGDHHFGTVRGVETDSGDESRA